MKLKINFGKTVCVQKYVKKFFFELKRSITERYIKKN